MLFRALFRLSQRKLILHDPRELKRIHQKAKTSKESTQHLKKTAAFTVSLVGLPNCGKSTLFNGIVGQRLALTDSIPGMTRDRKELIIWDGMLRLIDTAGVQQPQSKNNNDSPMHTMREDMFRQTITASNESDLTLLIVDAKKGITDEEKTFVQYMRKYGGGRKTILVVNKCDAVDESELLQDVGQLGFPEIHYVSAEHGNGVLELMQTIDKSIPDELRDVIKNKKKQRRNKFNEILKEMREQFRKLSAQDADVKGWERDFVRLNPNPEENSQLDEDQPNLQSFTKPEQIQVTGRGVHEKNESFKKPIQLCIIGRPNVGKSSLINHLLGEQKMVVSEIPNTTRDAISTEWTYKDRKMKLVDTAGLSSTNFDRNPQHLKKVQIATMNHVQFSHVVIYLLDALSAMKEEDFTFIRRVIKEGRAVVLAVNKWEAVKSDYKKKAARYMQKQIESHLGELNSPEVVYISVKTNQGVERLMDAVLKVYERWNRRISTGLLNDWLRRFKKLDNLPVDGNNQLKIRYVVQAKSRPPTFVAFVNNNQLFKENYLRFMRGNLVEEFGLQGVAVRILLKNIKSTGNQATPKAKAKQALVRQRKQYMKSMQRKEKLLALKKKYGEFGTKA